MIGTYLRCLIQMATQCIHWFFNPVPTYYTDCISNLAILNNNFVSLLSDLSVHMCTTMKMVSQIGSHSFWGSGYKGLTRLRCCEKAMGCAMLPSKCCCFVCNPALQVCALLSYIARLKKEEERKIFGPFWFGTFVMLSRTTGSLVGNENSRRWVVRCYKALLVSLPFLRFCHILCALQKCRVDST